MTTPRTYRRTWKHSWKVLAVAVALLGAPAAAQASDDGVAPAEAGKSNAAAVARMTEESESLAVTKQALPITQVTAATPVPPSVRIGSRYGMRRGRTTGAPTFHAGLDFAAPRGTPVYAAHYGSVAIVANDADESSRFSGYGNAIVIHHEELEDWTMYAHLDEVLVEPGETVLPGQLIGRVGNSTNGKFPGMGVHLHFEVREMTPHGKSPFPGPYRRNNVDPEAWLEDLGLQYGADGTLEAVDRELDDDVDAAYREHHLSHLGFDEVHPSPALVVRELQPEVAEADAADDETDA